MTKSMKTLIWAVSFVVLLISSFFIFSDYIDFGKEGIKVNLYGKNADTDIQYVSGRVFYIPFYHRIVKTPLTVQSIDYPEFKINDKDGTTYDVDPTLMIQLRNKNSAKIYRKYMLPIGEVLETAIFTQVKDIYRREFNKYTTDSIIGNRNVFEAGIEKEIRIILEEEGFDFGQLTSGIKYPPELVNSINAKNTAVQDSKRKENELQSVIIDGQKSIRKAMAEDSANAIRKRNLTPLIIQQDFIEKWDGKSSLYGNSPIFTKSVDK